MEKRPVFAAVIGGGAAGMLCAIRIAERHPHSRVMILEKADRVGKKLLVTGNGRCNLTNINASPAHYHGEGCEKLIRILFERYSPETVLKEFRTLGLIAKPDSEGRVYPYSNLATSVLDVLRRRIAELNIDVLCDAAVRSLQHTSGGWEIACADKRIVAEKLVISTGGRADYAGRPMSGDLLRMLGLSVNKATPSLSPIRVKGDLLRPLKGVRAEAAASLIIGGETVKTERGEVQFTENALSGICIFNLSREANRTPCTVSLNLLPDMTRTEIADELTRRACRDSDAPASDIFLGLFHKNLGVALLKSSGIRPSELCCNISNRELNALAKTITDWRFSCEPSSDFKKAQVTAGGVRLSEIDPHTFSARRQKDLTIIGEALDVDGDCGGYNLQFAWASALSAGDSL